jgi:hypothetical protein
VAVVCRILGGERKIPHMRLSLSLIHLHTLHASKDQSSFYIINLYTLTESDHRKKEKTSGDAIIIPKE